MLAITRTDSDHPHFGQLVARLDAFLADHDGDDHTFYAQFNPTVGLPNVVLAHWDAQPVACGAFRLMDGGVVEIKRMFVDEASRGQGVAARVLAELESWAVELGARRAILETGVGLLPAVRLYRRSNYQVIENYPPYVGVDTSVCMGKNLAER